MAMKGMSYGGILLTHIFHIKMKMDFYWWIVLENNILNIESLDVLT